MPIPISSLRSSAFGTHKLCEARFVLDYSLGYSGFSNKKADQGTILHKVMEILANVVKYNGKFYDEETDINIAVDDIWTYDIRALTDKVYHHHIKIMTDHIWEDKDLKDIHKWVETCITYNNGQFDPRNRTIVDVEKRFSFEMEYPWAIYKDKDNSNKFLKLNGTIDLVTQISPDIYEIVDYKSGKRSDFATNEIKDHNYLKNDIQLRIYHYAAHRLYPNVKQVILTIFYLKDGGPFTIQFDRSEIDKTIELIRAKYEQIRDTVKPTFLKDEKPHERWKCKYVCPHYKQEFEGLPPIIEMRKGQVTKMGEPMCRCEYLHYALKHRTIEQIIENMTKEGFKEGGYSQGLKHE